MRRLLAAAAVIALNLAVLLQSGCRNPHLSKESCRAQGGLVVHDGHPVCQVVETCTEDRFTVFKSMTCRQRQECEEAPWHCELPAEAN